MKKFNLKINTFIFAIIITLTLCINIVLANSSNKSIIEDDNRTTAIPDGRIVSILTLWPDGSKNLYTGFLISNRHVATTSSAMYNLTKGGKYSLITVNPMHTGEYGVFHATEKSVYNEDWLLTPSNNFGIIELNKNVPYTLGRFKFKMPSDHDLHYENFSIIGYDSNFTNDQWLSNGEIENFTPHFLYYNMDTATSTIGAPILDSNYNVIGIHTSDEVEVGYHNYGLRVTKQFLDQINSWKAQFDVIPENINN